MTVQAAKFTPEVLLSAPRRTPGTPNSSGEKVLYSVSTYSFENHTKTAQIRVLDVPSGKSSLLYENSTYTEPTWIGETEFIFFQNMDRGVVALMHADVEHPGAAPKQITILSGAFANLKVKRLSEDTVAFVCSAPAKPNGSPYNPETEPKKYTSAKVYSSLFVRHWDSYISENTNALWYGLLERTQTSDPQHQENEGQAVGTTSTHSWTLSGNKITNVLNGTGLECPVPPFGGTGDFDLSATGIAFVARDPSLSPAIYTKSDLYYVPLSTFTESPPAPQIVATGNLKGYSASPAFSPSGKSLIFTRMKSEQYESDKPRLLLISDVSKIADGVQPQEFYDTEDGEGGWDLRPDWLLWSNDAKTLYVAAEKNGRNVLWQLPSSPSEAASNLPVPVVADGSVSDAKPLSDNSSKLFISGTSLVDSSVYSIVEPCSNGTASPCSPSITLVSSISKNGKSFGLSKKTQFDEFWFQGAGEYDVHALVMKPSDFDPSKKYPLAFLIHGGPQGAWNDGWSTRWNPAIFAEQGYVAVMPNPTGSTGYGMALENGIKENWGGRPYEDLVKCFEWIESNMDYVDIDRAVALGASYGGFMINWIQGHPLGRKFKALVCHDGVFSTLNQYSSEELFFPIHDFGGPFWENREGYEKWDPAKFVGNWSTPQLVIHNELDYRLPISEGLAAFNILQSRGVPSRFLTFPDENHWVLKPDNSLIWHREVLGWINKYSGITNSTETKEALPERKRTS